MARITELYEKIANQIVAQMNDGVLPWHRPWAVSPNARVSKPLRQNAVPYQGINVLILWGAAIDAGYASPFWMTYRQAQSIGAQVRKGERATHIVFAKTAKKRERDEASGEEVEAIIPVRRVYAVFNADQIDGLPEKYVPEVPDVNPDERDAACQAWVDSLGIEIRYGGVRVDAAVAIGVDDLGGQAAQAHALLHRALGDAEPGGDLLGRRAVAGEPAERHHLVGGMHGDAHGVLGQRGLDRGLPVDDEARHGVVLRDRLVGGERLQRPQAPRARRDAEEGLAARHDDEVLEEPVGLD